MKQFVAVSALGMLGGLVVLTLGSCGGAADPQLEQEFRETLGDTSITVFPAAIRRETVTYDHAATLRIGEFLAAQKLAQPTISDAEVPLSGPWHSNESTMWQESAASLGTYVKAHPIQTRYALLPEYLILGGSGAVGGVHVYVVRDDGALVFGFGLNSHHEAFKRLSPKTVDDCTTLAIDQLRAQLVTDNGTAKVKSGLKADTALTIVPVAMHDGPSKDVADVVGLMLEKEGMPNIWTTDAAFNPAAAGSLDELATAFAKFIKAHPVETEYALFAQLLGTPQTGLTESRAVLVDKAGAVVWKDQQGPDDADFQRIQPREPMQCCLLLCERLKPVFHLSAVTRAKASEGRMARLWAEKSGTPTDAERAAMHDRVSKLKAAIGKATIAVYPVLLGDQVDRQDGEQLAALVAEEFGGSVQAAATDLPLKIAPNSNEQRRLWDLARAFQAQVRANPPAADYALYAEYTIRPIDQQVWTVHFVVCNRAGEWVIVDFQNNHHDDFQRINPQNKSDCARLIVKRLQGYLR